MASGAMLIQNADILGHGMGDLRIDDGRVVAIGRLHPLADEAVIDAGGGALLPGLHDHHIHMAALAARRASVFCGPPEVRDLEGLSARIGHPGTGWLRGIGYHESVAGMLDRALLDRIVPDRPVRIQHRSGRMWFFNSAGLETALTHVPAPPGLDHATGRLFDEDPWLRTALGGAPPDLGAVSAELAAMGVTGITDMTPANDPGMAGHFARAQASGDLRQRCLLAGTLALSGVAGSESLAIGPAKLHLHEADLPDYDGATGFIAAAHAQGRAVAIHCVTEVELVFALAALVEAGAMPGDRIEHASIAPDVQLAEIARLGLAVVAQPHFIAERGDEYRAAVEPQTVPDLYRLRAFRQADVTLAGGSDAPFGKPDPWAAMRAAVARQTPAGVVMRAEEALTPDEALALFLADPVDLGMQRRLAPGVAADLCLLDRPWRESRLRLSVGDVRATFIGGVPVHQRFA